MMRRERVTVLSEKTRSEMAAGREAIGLPPDHHRIMLDAIHHEVVASALKPLQKQFPAIVGATHIDWDTTGRLENWSIEINVRCPNGETMQATDKFVGFPSDELVATLMLLVG